MRITNLLSILFAGSGECLASLSPLLTLAAVITVVYVVYLVFRNAFA